MADTHVDESVQRQDVLQFLRQLFAKGRHTNLWTGWTCRMVRDKPADVLVAIVAAGFKPVEGSIGEHIPAGTTIYSAAGVLVRYLYLGPVTVVAYKDLRGDSGC